MIPRLTPTERRILDMLADGEPHSPSALMCCLSDELATVKNLRDHIYHCRVKLRSMEFRIACVYHNRTLHYQLVRRVESFLPDSVVGT